MSSYLSADQIAAFTGIFGNHFDTFSHDRTKIITIYKEPLRTVVSSPVNPAYGYGQPSANSSVTYTDVTGIYPAVVMFDLDQKQTRLEDVKNAVNKGTVRIKVEEDAKAFLEDGRKNIRIEFENKTFNIISSDGVQNFLGLKYYIYNLENTL